MTRYGFTARSYMRTLWIRSDQRPGKFRRLEAGSQSTALYVQFRFGRFEDNGLVDDVCIYNYALAPEDVKALHEGVPHKRGAQE